MLVKGAIGCYIWLFKLNDWAIVIGVQDMGIIFHDTETMWQDVSKTADIMNSYNKIEM